VLAALLISGLAFGMVLGGIDARTSRRQHADIPCAA
jgi:hypothetical protein